MSMQAQNSPDSPATASTLVPASLLVTAQAIQGYAELTNDFNPLHVDAEFAAKSPVGRQIAHGSMSLCLVWQCLCRHFGASALERIALDVRFVKPVYIGDRVTAGGQARPGQPGQWDVWVRGDDGSDRIVGVFQLDD